MAVLFTLFDESSITPLPCGSVIYPVEGVVKYSFAGWQGSICRVAICPRLRPDIPFVSAAWSIFWIFSFQFLFRYFFVRKCIFQGIFSRMPNFFYFLNSFTVIRLSVILAGFAEAKATTCGDRCGSRRERMALVLWCHIAWHILLV